MHQIFLKYEKESSDQVKKLKVNFFDVSNTYFRFTLVLIDSTYTHTHIYIYRHTLLHESRDSKWIVDTFANRFHIHTHTYTYIDTHSYMKYGQ